MNTLAKILPELVQVPAPQRNAENSQWWPDLYLKNGRTLQQVSVPQLAKFADAYREAAMNDGRGASDTPEIKLYTINGKKPERIGYVSWNGRIWLHDVEGDVEVPQ